MFLKQRCLSKREELTSLVGKIVSDPSKDALASLQHLLRLAPELARWSLDTLRWKNRLGTKKDPTGRDKVCTDAPCEMSKTVMCVKKV